MIRTAISFLVLFGSLVFVSKLVIESQSQEAAQPKVGQKVSGGVADLPVPRQLLSVNARKLLTEVEVCCDGECHSITDSAVHQVALQIPDDYDSSERYEQPIGSGLRDDIEEEPSNAPITISDEDEDQSVVEQSTDSESEESAEQTIGDESDESTARTIDDEAVTTKPKQKSTLAPANREKVEETSTIELSAEMLALQKKVRDVLAYHIERPEAVEQRSPWGIMHALIAYGVDTEVTQGGRRVNAIGWMCFNGPCRGQQLLGVEHGKLLTHVGVGVQGHDGQFLAMLAQSKVKTDFPISIDGQKFTVADLIEYEKQTCQEGTELTFKLIALSHYLDTNAKWKNRQGQKWDMQKLIKEELAQPVIGAACGGTHRMMGFSYAVRNRQKDDQPITGQWLRAQKYVDAYHEYTFSMQNDDGSFSTNWFRGPGNLPDIDRRIETTGHTLEWLSYSLPKENLLDARTVKAVKYLTNLMWENRDHEWEIGPKGHALHALAIYDERLFQGKPGERRTQLAEHRKSTSAR